MLTFYFGGHKVHIDHTGDAHYWRVDDQYRYARTEGKGWVKTLDPPGEIVTLAGSILQLIATDVVKAGMRVAQLAQLAQELQSAKATLERAVYEQCASGTAISDCTIEVTLVSERLKAAEGALQRARAGV